MGKKKMHPNQELHASHQNFLQEETCKFNLLILKIIKMPRGKNSLEKQGFPLKQY